MKKRSVIYLVFGIQLIFSVTFLAAQSNELVDQLLEQEKASYGHSAYMILTAIGELPKDASPQEATSVLREKGWDLSARETDGSVSLGEYSYLIMRFRGAFVFCLLSMLVSAPSIFAETVFEYDGFTLTIEQGTVVLSNKLGQIRAIGRGGRSSTDFVHDGTRGARDAHSALFGLLYHRT